MKNKIMIFVASIFIFVGLLMFIIFKYVMNELSKPVENSKEAIATISIINDEDVYLTFIDENGETYTAKSNYVSSNMRIGDKLKIYYNSKNPNIIKVNTEEFDKMFSWMFYGMFIFMILIGVIILIIPIKLNRNKNKLLTEGLMLSATITSVDYNPYININGRHPYIIRASFIYNGLTYETKSENIWNNPQYIIDNYNIRELPVYINPNKPTSNILDINELKNKLGK